MRAQFFSGSLAGVNDEDECECLDGLLLPPVEDNNGWGECPLLDEDFDEWRNE